MNHDEPADQSEMPASKAAEKIDQAGPASTESDPTTESDQIPDAVPDSAAEPDPAAKPGAESAPEKASDAASQNRTDTEPADEPDSTDGTAPTPATETIDDGVRQVLIETLQANIELFKNLGTQLTEENITNLQELGSSLPDLILQISKSKTVGLESEPLAFARLIKAVILSSQRNGQIEELITSAATLSHKKTNQLVSTRKLLRQLKSEIGWPLEAPKSATFEKLLATELKLDAMAEKNQRFQEQLLDSTKELIDNLSKTLEQGNSTDASALWDKIQGNINNLSGRAQHDFKLQTTEFRNQINELRGWKKFAATEKKKELIETMRQLSESTASPPEQARQINKLHEEWKRLGYSNQNETLWREFKTASDLAYAPCKEYFKQQKSVLAENFIQRSEICNQLAHFLENLDRDKVKIVELKKFESQVQEDWKKYAPIEQSKVKKLQKRFYELLNQLRDIRRGAARKNGEAKQSLVKQAQSLLELEDRREAMNKARDLQAEWKTIGPSFFKDDRKYWEEFRAACDALFKERDEARKALKSNIESALKSSNDILRQLEEMFALEEEPFRQSRELFPSLQRDFNQAFSPQIKKERQQLLNRFNTLTRKIEARFKKLPDRKQLQALNALQARAQLCLELENRLLTSTDDEVLQTHLKDIDPERWQQLEHSGNPDLDKAMESRWKALFTLKTMSRLSKLTEELDQTARRQVVEAEISAHLDSPEHDKALRMELQLNQLTSSFGKASTDTSSSREREARELQLRFLCIGPLSHQMRSELEPRVARILEKIL
jgi:exonuclease SbcC